jgi:hypothetical protein
VADGPVAILEVPTKTAAAGTPVLTVSGSDGLQDLFNMHMSGKARIAPGTRIVLARGSWHQFDPSGADRGRPHRNVYVEDLRGEPDSPIVIEGDGFRPGEPSTYLDIGNGGLLLGMECDHVWVRGLRTSRNAVFRSAIYPGRRMAGPNEIFCWGSFIAIYGKHITVSDLVLDEGATSESGRWAPLIGVDLSAEDYRIERVEGARYRSIPISIKVADKPALPAFPRSAPVRGFIKNVWLREGYPGGSVGNTGIDVQVGQGASDLALSCELLVEDCGVVDSRGFGYESKATGVTFRRVYVIGSGQGPCYCRAGRDNVCDRCASIASYAGLETFGQKTTYQDCYVAAPFCPAIRLYRAAPAHGPALDCKFIRVVCVKTDFDMLKSGYRAPVIEWNSGWQEPTGVETGGHEFVDCDFVSLGASAILGARGPLSLFPNGSTFTDCTAWNPTGENWGLGRLPGVVWKDPGFKWEGATPGRPLPLDLRADDVHPGVELPVQGWKPAWWGSRQTRVVLPHIVLERLRSY